MFGKGLEIQVNCKLTTLDSEAFASKAGGGNQLPSWQVVCCYSNSLLQLLTQCYDWLLIESQLNKALEKEYPHIELRDTRKARWSNETGSSSVLLVTDTQSSSPTVHTREEAWHCKILLLSELKGNAPVLPSNHAADEWTRLYIEAKENGGERRISQSTADSETTKEWDAVDCDIQEYRMKTWQAWLVLQSVPHCCLLVS